MDLRLERKKIRLTYGDEQYDVRIPTTKQIKRLSDDLKKKNTDEVQVLYDLLTELGLPSDVIDDMDFMSLNELVDYLSGKKSLSKT